MLRAVVEGVAPKPNGAAPVPEVVDVVEAPVGLNPKAGVELAGVELGADVLGAPKPKPPVVDAEVEG